ncbi:putative membrane protein [Streptococcus troglodytae]|uniref:Putative membrane protein n=1 Tax=Streptococcus troglodytae TaxID=1111760 RepID=A0A1L7LKB3_9STRE|nr:putative membrane protein [Streptococcus troglodytae]
MLKKRMLESYTHRYEHFPAWLTILIACVMVILFFLLGQLGGGFLVGLLSVPFIVVKPEMANSFLILFFSISFVYFVALINFAWVKWYEKRSIASLGFFKKQWFLEILKGWGVGMGIFPLLFVDLSVWWCGVAGY